MNDSKPALDPFGFPLRWSIQTRREIRRVTKSLEALTPAEIDRHAAGRQAADALATEPLSFEARTKAPIDRPEIDLSAHRIVLALPFPIQTGGMRVLMQLAGMLAGAGAQVHVRQVRGDDCQSAKYDDFGFASRMPIGGPEHLTEALREAGPATVLSGCWIDYYAAFEAGTGPLIGYSAGEPTLKETEPFDQALLDFAYHSHRLPVTLWAGSRFVQNVYRDRFGRASRLISVPIAAEMFDRQLSPAPQPPFRTVLVGPEHLTTKGIPGALTALSPLRDEGFRIVWISPDQPSPELAKLADEIHVGLNADGVADVVGSCHGLVFPSRLEGLGNPPLEAMALGVPSILCPNGGSDEYAEPERNCLQVPYADDDRLRTAVRRLRDEPALTESLRHSGYHTAERYRPANVSRAVTGFLAERGDHLPS